MEGRVMYLLEGNISAGKTTLGRALDESGLFAFLPEPVDQWRSGFAANLLDRFYSDMGRWAFTFQLAAFTTRAKAWDDVIKMTDHGKVVLERSIYCDRNVFALNCRRSGLMDEAEWQVYCRLWDWLEARWCVRPERILYLRTPAELCLERLRRRSRSEENVVSLDYLKRLEALHDEWLLPLEGPEGNVLVLDGERRWSAEEVAGLLAESS